MPPPPPPPQTGAAHFPWCQEHESHGGLARVFVPGGGDSLCEWMECFHREYPGRLAPDLAETWFSLQNQPFTKRVIRIWSRLKPRVVSIDRFSQGLTLKVVPTVSRLGGGEGGLAANVEDECKPDKMEVFLQFRFTCNFASYASREAFELCPAPCIYSSSRAASIDCRVWYPLHEWPTAKKKPHLR
ncbi:hypothetical protein IF1G_03787 [Cordyceps javanica]|uniref:Uncharacterized protein n=1 Tax=Cordyceps javanica TaxID=43265 RepID=A0A545V8I8_9HYPO|nr:hypothetical protein IF1G_03787 [Cordyceps javanica]